MSDNHNQKHVFSKNKNINKMRKYHLIPNEIRQKFIEKVILGKISRKKVSYIFEYLIINLGC